MRKGSLFSLSILIYIEIAQNANGGCKMDVNLSMETAF